MKIVIGHISADFDVLASMVAVHKLYPDVLMVLTGQPEKSVRDYLLTNPVPHLKIYKHKEIDLEQVTEIILVDTRYKNRIGPFKELVEKPGMKVSAYDHHPMDQGDIVPDELFHQEVGSTVTILVNELKKRRIKIPPAEATLIALGIYEDTGCLTYLFTKKADLQATEYLLDQGATLVDIPSFLHTELSSEQLPLFADIIKGIEYYHFEGVQVGISTIICTEYIGELALFIHKLRDIGHIPAVFVLAQLKDRVQIVARSQTRSVNIALVLAELGGGGHRSAGSAVIHDKSLDEVRKKLIEQLNLYVDPMLRAKDFMTSPVMTVSPETRLEQIRKIILRYHHNAYPVVQGKTILGTISSMDVNKALHHELGRQTVDKFMNQNIIQVDAFASLKQVRELLLQPGTDVILVTESSGRLIGVVTRTDILRATHELDHSKTQMQVSSALPVLTAKLRKENLKELMQSRISDKVYQLLEVIGQVGDKMDYAVYIVGGYVRDLFLNLPNYDLDIVVEGDGIAFARKLAKELKGKVKSHKRFNTAIVTTQEHQKIDIATARTEFYEYPAALPIVESSNIKHDLYRRDFTINAMALKLNPVEFGQLYDYFNGMSDLKHGRVKVLHNLSFVEDPTRIFRAVRFEQRYSFKMEKQTRLNISNALELDMFTRLGNERVREEIILILSEPHPWKAIKRMHDLRILPCIHPRINMSPEQERVLKSIATNLDWYAVHFTLPAFEPWQVYFLGLIDALNLDDTRQVCERLVMMVKVRDLACKIKLLELVKTFQAQNIINLGMIYKSLKEIPVEGVLYLLSKLQNPLQVELIKQYLVLIPKTKSELSGDDLIKMGIPPGPRYKEILDELFINRLNGNILSKEDEINYLCQHYLPKK